MKRELKAILFDMGSTLLEFENHTWDVLGRMCAEKGYGFLRQNNPNLLSFEEFSKLLIDGFLKARAEVAENLKEFRFEEIARNLFDILNLSASDGLYHSFVETYYEPVTDQITLMDGAVEVLQYFKERNLKIGIVSNTIFPENYHLKELKRFGLYPHLDFYVFSSTIGVRKPHSQIFLQALNELEVKSSEAVFVGDRLVEDVGGAQKVGMKGILRYHKGRDYTAPIIPDAQIGELNELAKVLIDIL